MWRRVLGIVAKVIGIVVLILFLITAFIPPMLYFYYRRFIFTSANVVPKEDAIVLVLGAGVQNNETPSSALQERLDVVTTLYKEGKVSSIIVSGAKDTEYYNEPKVMKDALQKAGVPDSIITEDPEGFRTYDSCYRAKNVYNMNKGLIVSQGYHLPRALFLCRSMGIDAAGVYAEGAFSTYYSRWYTVREVMAMYMAVWDVLIR